MAEAVYARIGCTSAVECSRQRKSFPFFRSLRNQVSPESLSFQKFVSSRPSVPSLGISQSPGWSPVQVNAVVGYPASIAWYTKGNQPNMRDINSAQEFVEAINNAGDKLVLVDFYSVGCRSCKALHPKICQIAEDNPDIEVLKINFHENKALCRCLKVSVLPFLHFYRGKAGRIDAFSCSLTKIAKLRAAVAKHKGDQLALPAPGPVAPVADRKDLKLLLTSSLATASSV